MGWILEGEGQFLVFDAKRASAQGDWGGISPDRRDRWMEMGRGPTDGRQIRGSRFLTAIDDGKKSRWIPYAHRMGACFSRACENHAVFRGGGGAGGGDVAI